VVIILLSFIEKQLPKEKSTVEYLHRSDEGLGPRSYTNLGSTYELTKRQRLSQREPASGTWTSLPTFADSKTWATSSQTPFDALRAASASLGLAYALVAAGNQATKS
jgi:hypothetical protein